MKPLEISERILIVSSFMLPLIIGLFGGYIYGISTNPFGNTAFNRATFYYVYSSNGTKPVMQYAINQSIIVKCYEFNMTGHGFINCTKAQYAVNALPDTYQLIQLQNTTNFTKHYGWHP